MSEYFASISVNNDKKEVISASSHVALIQEVERLELEITKEINSIWTLGISPGFVVLTGWGFMGVAYATSEYIALFALLILINFVLLMCEWIVYSSRQGTNFSLESHRLPALYARRRKWRDEYARQNNPDSRSSP